MAPTMTVDQVMAELKKLADPRAVKVWQKMGMPTDKYLGVNITKSRDLAKKIKTNHGLATELWAEDIHDARLLATFIADPREFTEKSLHEWVSEADFFDITDKIAQHIVPSVPFASKLMTKWMKSKEEFVRRTGWMTLAHWGATSPEMSEAELTAHLKTIETKIHSEANWVREAMNYALIAIGKRDAVFNAVALAAAKRIGPVKVDYGDTSCKVPDAIVYLTKSRS